MSLTVRDCQSRDTQLAVLLEAADLSKPDDLKFVLHQMISAGNQEVRKQTEKTDLLIEQLKQVNNKHNNLTNEHKKLSNKCTDLSNTLNNLKRNGYRKKADQKLKEIRCNLKAAKSGQVALMAFGIVTVPLFVGIGAIIGAQEGVKPAIIKLKKERWIYKNFPEVVDASVSKDSRATYEAAYKIIDKYYEEITAEQEKHAHDDLDYSPSQCENCRENPVGYDYVGDFDYSSPPQCAECRDQDWDRGSQEVNVKPFYKISRDFDKDKLRAQVDATFYPALKV